MIITEPGIYEIPPEEYHADPVPEGSLSQTGAKKLLPPSCPALFHHDSQHPAPYKAEFSLGHAAHKLILSEGAAICVIDAADWRTKKARQERDEAHASGQIPLLPHEDATVQAMAKAILEHPVASQLFKPGAGKPEQSLFWRDERSGIWLRARLDWLPNKVEGRRLIIPDFKTCNAADLEAIPKAVHTHGYHQQAAFYLEAVRVLLNEDAVFLFVFQEKSAPYLVTVAQLDHDALRIGRARNRRAIQVYRECRETGIWPGYTNNVELISLPRWAEVKELEDIL